MKLLLTSAGITNLKIADTLLELTGLPADKIKFCFVPTAANMEVGDKEWLIENLIAFKNQGFESITIVDIAAVPRKIWLKQFEEAYVICFGGGNENYLARILKEQGVKDILVELLKTRVYMGISAGSMVAGKFPRRDILELIYDETDIEGELEPTLEFVNLHFKPHLNSEYFTNMRKEKIEALKNVTAPIYALDDQCALKIIDEKIEVIGGGEYFIK